nr:alpha/beta hydrolase [Candidatus Sigynarchaeota archaeon]
LFRSFTVTFAGVKTEDISIAPSDPLDHTIVNDTISLHGRLYYPPCFSPSGMYPGVVLFHGVTRTLEDCHDTARRLASKGCVCLSISFHGHGLSSGTFPSDGRFYNESFGDANGAYRYLHNLSFIDKTRLGSVGHSMGGGAGIFLALQGLVPEFVAWYPATAYLWIDTPLYQHVGTDPGFAGYIIQGTNDTCSRCLPNFTMYFVDANNGKVNVTWVEGGVHGATAFDYPFYVQETIAWFASRWDLNDLVPEFMAWLRPEYILLGGLAVIVIVDVPWAYYLVVKERRRENR